MAVIEGDEFMDRFKELLRSPTMQPGAKAHRIVDLLEDLFARSWIFCRHMVLILECFAANYGYLRQTKNHGTYRVDVIVALFGRIVDLHNFEFVVSWARLCGCTAVSVPVLNYKSRAFVVVIDEDLGALRGGLRVLPAGLAQRVQPL
jgi:hypothetical protein